MSSILKVDQIQLADGSTPTAADLGLNTTGGVLQVQQGSFNSSASYSLDGSGGANRRAAIGLSVNITPTSSTSKILVLVQVNLGSSGNVGPGIIIKRGSTDIGIGNQEGSRDRVSSGGVKTVASYEDYVGVFAQILDTPNTTSQTTYSVDIINKRNSADTQYVNRGALYSDTNQFQTASSTITVMEIAG